VLCVASVRSSSRASSSSCTSSIVEEEEDSEISGDEFVPPRPVTTRKPTQRQCNMDRTLRHKPVLKPSTPQYQSQREATALLSGFGWRTRPQQDGATAVTSDTCPLSQQSLPTTPINTGGIFKVPRTPPVTSSSRQARDAVGSRIQRPVRIGEDQKGVDGGARLAANAESTKVIRAATPPPPALRLHASSSDLAINTSSSTRTQSRIPTRAGARHPQRDAGRSSRGSSPGSTK